MDVKVTLTASQELLDRIDAITKIWSNSTCPAPSTACKASTAPAASTEPEPETEPEIVPEQPAPRTAARSRARVSTVPKVTEVPKDVPKDEDDVDTIEEVRGILFEATKDSAEKKAAARALLAEFKVTNVSALKASDYNPFVKRVRAL